MRCFDVSKGNTDYIVEETVVKLRHLFSNLKIMSPGTYTEHPDIPSLKWLSSQIECVIQ